MKALLIKIRQILRDRRTRRFLTRFVSGIAAIVVFVTTYALVLPAITMESQANCGIEAHQHDDSCYSEELICGLEESEGHHHTEDCYTVTRTLVCQTAEHQHSSESGCFAEDGSLICTLEEHTHDDSCYEENRELTCGLEESEGHHHTDSCYEKVLTCQKEVHTHSAACYKADLEIESAAVASTGMTSAAAVPDYSDEDDYSDDSDDSQDNGTVSGARDEAEETDADDEQEDDKATGDDRSEEDADTFETDNGEAEDSADSINENTGNGKNSDEEGEETASSFSTGFAADEDSENGDSYIPEKEELEFKAVLNRRTGIYYHHVAEDEDIEDSSVITDWDRADKDTELAPQDLIRVYLSYTLPKDTINATNDISRYRLPDTLHLTDDQIEAINTCENGISAQYINYDNLEVTDPERHTAYLGLESVEGTRRPGEEPEEDSQEYISATVKAEKIYDEETGEYEGTDLIFTFSPYTVEKNAHAYDKKGQPTRAGEEVTGWLTLDFNMGQIDWAEDNTSEIVFAEEDRENGISENMTVLRQADPSQAEADDQAADGMTEAAAEDMTGDEDAADAATEAAAADETAETTATDDTSEAAAADATGEAALADNTSEKAEETGTEKTAVEAAEDLNEEKDKKEESAAVSYPAAVFDDSITVRSGRLDTDLDDTDIPKKTKMTVHVEADEGTFPEGTKMVLSAVEDINAVAEAVGTAIDAKTRGFQAVDITFYDKDPSEEDAKEIEPLKPIRVSIKSDEIRKAAEDSSTAPVVVHIEDDNTAKEIENTASKTDSSAIEIEKPAADPESTGDSALQPDAEQDKEQDNGSEKDTDSHERTESDKSASPVVETGNESADTDGSTDKAGSADTEETPDTAGSSADTNGSTDTAGSAENISENEESADKAGTGDTVDFEADAFSVYVIVYTVDLHAQVITASGDTYAVTVSCGEDAQIPDNAELNVREILSTDEEYADLFNSAAVKACSDAEEQGIEMPIVSGARLFDIEILGENGKIEPAAPVQVSIRLLGSTAADHTSVVHFGKDEVEALEAQTSEIETSQVKKTNTGTSEAEETETLESAEKAVNAADVTEISFQAESFSVYSVVKVTDFSTIAGSNKKYALVTGIANDPGATTGYDENWGTDYFTIIVNAHAVSDQHALDNQNRVNGLQVEPVHAYEDGSVSYVGGSPVQWQFESAGNGKYYLSANSKYLQRYNSAGYNHQYGWQARLVDSRNDATQFSITVNDDGTILIYDDRGGDQRYYLHNEGSGEWSSRIFSFTNQNVNTSSQAYRFRLCEESDQFDSFAARKVSVQNLTVNDSFLIYRRFEDSQGNEQLYALASDGTFVQVYDGGDTVYWRETTKNLYWHYRLEGGYYCVYSTNPLTNETVYINPMHSSDPEQTITSEPSRLTLIGKDNGDYGTALENWDQAAYDYAGLHVTINNQGKPELSTGTRVAGTSDTFLFAVASTMPGAAAETVNTVDSDSLGIKITMFDYGDAKGTYSAGDKLDSMASVVASDTSVANDYQPHEANDLVKPYLENGLPSSKTKGAMAGLFTTTGSAVTSYKENVNHLFLQSYYDENGMFRYRSEDNYAYLPFDPDTATVTSNDFIVYRQAATPYPYDTQPGHTYYTHGHFMPFNDIDMTQSVSRLMNQYGNEYTNGEAIGELPIGDGRTYEDIYGVQGTPNFYTGMKLEAEFTQLKDGKTENGDSMVFKFTGDDDMWVYIDGVLVLDVGGIHEPLSGTIDFSTGEVNNPTGSSLAGKKTLYDIFMDVLNDSSTPPSVKDKINSITWKDVNGDNKPDTFADYTNHDFKAFYMERGAGASNLDIQFNLKVLRPGEIVVEKELPEGVDPRFVNQVYKFRATFKDYTDNNTVKPLYKGAPNKNGESVCSSVYYKGRKDEEGNPVEVPVGTDGCFTLKAGEAAVFMLTDKNIEYTINEVEIDSDQKTELVEINGQVVQVVEGTAEAAYAKAGDRSQLKYKNHPYLQNLDITKHILPEGTQTASGDVFEFRVYLETRSEVDGEEIQQLVPYSYGPYYVTKLGNDGQIHYYTLTGTNNAPEDKGTNPVICSTTGRSGSINSIPPEYTVVIPKLAVGTHFYVEERRDNIPAGYMFDHEELIENTYDQQTLGSDAEIISRILARDEQDHQEFDPNTVGRIKKGVDARSEVFNRKATVNVQKQWLKMNGDAYTLDQARLLPGSTSAVITAELWRKKIVEETSEETGDPVTVTFMVNTTEADAYRQVSQPVTIKNGSTLEFSLGARGTSQAEEIYTDPEYDISRSSVSSNPKIRYSNGREKDKWSKYTISGITENTTVYATFDAEKVGDDFVGIYIASMEEPGSSSETPVEEKVADITLNNGNEWLQSVSMEQGYTYFLMNVAETGLEGHDHEYIFISEPTVTTDEDGNLILAVANKYREPIDITVEKKWSPKLTSDEENSAYVTVELHRYAKKTRGLLEVVLKDNYGAPIEGAVFKLYKDGVEQEGEYTTDVNGKVVANNLEPGTYQFKQISTPEGYLMPDSPPETEEFVVEDNRTDPQEEHCELQNQALRTNGVATITLLDNTGAPIRGAKYNLIKREGSHEVVISEALLTDENGQITVSQLEAGTYYFYETEPPEDYKLPDYWQDTDFTVQEHPGTIQYFHLSMTNDLRGKGYAEITLTGPDGQPVSGALFELYQGSEKLTDATTGNDGKLTFGDPDRLAVGTYIVKQVTTSSNLVPASEAKEFTILENGETNQKKELSFSNAYKGMGTATVTLTRKDNGNPISGATFELYKDGSLFETKQTNSNGQLTFGDPNKLTAGNYYIKQTSTDEGLDTAADQIFAIFENGNPDQQNDFSLENDELNNYYSLTFNSNDGNWSEGPYYYKSGAVVTVSFDNNNPWWNPYDGIVLSGAIVGTIGTYPNTREFTVTMDSDKTVTLTLNQQHYWPNAVTDSLKLSPEPEQVDPSSMQNASPNRSASLQNESSNTTKSRLLSSAKAPAQLDQDGQNSTTVSAAKGNDSATRDVPAVVNPSGPPSDDYIEDTSFRENDTEGVYTYTIRKGDNWKHVFEDLDRYDQYENPYYYYVVETDCKPDTYHIGSYTNDNLTETGTITVTNTYEAEGTLNFSAAKIFKGGALGGEDNTQFVFKLTQVTGNNRTTQATEDNVEKLILAAPETKTTTASSGNTDTVNFTPIALIRNGTTDQTGVYWFLLEEIVPDDVDANGIKDGIKYDQTRKWIQVTVTDQRDGTLSISKIPVETNGVDGTWTNEQLTNVSAHKAWLDMDGGQLSNAPEGATVEFTLHENGVATQKKVVLDGTVDENGEKEAWSAFFENLPKVDENGDEIVYTVVETRGFPEYKQVIVTTDGEGNTTIADAEGNTPASDGETIYNQKIRIIRAHKQWKNQDGNLISAPAKATSTITLYKLTQGTSSINKEQVGDPVVLDGTTDANGEEEAWVAVFRNLEADADYIVEESGLTDGFELVGLEAEIAENAETKDFWVKTNRLTEGTFLIVGNPYALDWRNNTQGESLNSLIAPADTFKFVFKKRATADGFNLYKYDGITRQLSAYDGWTYENNVMTGFRTAQNEYYYLDLSRTTSVPQPLGSTSGKPVDLYKRYTVPASGDYTFTVTNQQKKTDLGSLVINKKIFLGSNPDVNAPEKTYTFGIFNAPYAQGDEPVRTAELSVTGSEGSITVLNLEYGNYVVYELDDQGDPITGEHATIGAKYYKVEYSTTAAMTVDADHVPATEVKNTVETTSLEGTKTWDIISSTLPSDPTLTLTRVSAKQGAEPEIVKDTDNQNLQPVWSEVAGEANKRQFAYNDLPKYDAEGYEYTYTVSEAQFMVGDKTYTVTKENNAYIVKIGEETTAAFVVTQDNQNNITNTEMKEFSFTKEWYGTGQAAVEWLKDDQGNDIPINVTITGKKTGADDIVITKSLTSAEPAADAGYTITKDEFNGYTFTFTGLDNDFEYRVTEATIDGYHIEYYLKGSSEKQLSGIDWTDDGGTIKNILTTYELPESGGPGTKLFTILGAMLLVLAAAGMAFMKTGLKKRRL